MVSGVKKKKMGYLKYITDSRSYSTMNTWKLIVTNTSIHAFKSSKWINIMTKTLMYIQQTCTRQGMNGDQIKVIITKIDNDVKVNIL